jgi:hypothetical protein
MRPSLTDAERQARLRARLRALATEPERLPSGNYRDVCADCGQIMVAASIDELDGARCACPPTRYAYLVELVCAPCARPVTTVRVPTPRTRVLLFRPLRCGIRGGVAVQGEVTRVYVPESMPTRPRRGRPSGRLRGLRHDVHHQPVQGNPVV